MDLVKNVAVINARVIVMYSNNCITGLLIDLGVNQWKGQTPPILLKIVDFTHTKIIQTPLQSKACFTPAARGLNLPPPMSGLLVRPFPH